MQVLVDLNSESGQGRHRSRDGRWFSLLLSGVLAEPGPVPGQAGCHVVAGGEPGRLLLGDLLVKPGHQLVIL
jgi:hypothetical protein